MMREKHPKPDFLALQRRQLDSTFNESRHLSKLERPKKGWIGTIRGALGMSREQLGKRLKITRQGVFDLERREADETITLETLRKAANALNADLVVAVVPRKPLEEIVYEQAKSKALAERNRITHTMRLESQETGIEDALNPRGGIEGWLTKRTRKLWD
jgi:predicted DNA-binding mobile mystery protein A